MKGWRCDDGRDGGVVMGGMGVWYLRGNFDFMLDYHLHKTVNLTISYGSREQKGEGSRGGRGE